MVAVGLRSCLRCQGGMLCIDNGMGQAYDRGVMRWISVILIFSLACALGHEAASHEGAGEALSRWFSHSGPPHGHERDGEADHDHHSDGTDHDSDHHDAETHDHLSDIMLVKKDPSTEQRSVSDGVLVATGQLPNSLSLAVAPSGLHPVRHIPESSLPAYVRAHVLRL